MFTFELQLLALLVAAALLTHRLAGSWLGRSIDFLAQRRRLMLWLVGGMAFAVSAAQSLVGHMPLPAVHDEFSYLLAADTFARGRLTNPTHMMWEHLETYHVIQQPTYQSKFPPGQGFVLAAGRLCVGSPIVGVWLSVAAGAAATCWMLQGWAPPRWALLGGMITVAHPGIGGWWSQTYWGGAVAMTGGALVFGGIRRIMRRPCAIQAVIVGIGLVILANSRPYEGLVASVPVLLLLLGQVVWSAHRSVMAVRVLAPLVGVVVLAGGCMCYYNYRVTSHLFVLPYQAWQEQYASGSVLSNTGATPPDRNGGERPRGTIFVGTQGGAHRKELREVGQTSALIKLGVFWAFYVRPLCTLPLLALPWMLKNRWIQFGLLTIAVELVAFGLQPTQANPHYVAPVTGLVQVVVVQGLRHLCHWRLNGARIGRSFVGLFPVAAAVTLVIAIADRTQGLNSRVWGQERANIQRQLAEDGRRHLVLVKYGPRHDPLEEWVYNEADIDNAPVVWARWLQPAQNRRLLEYFRGRVVWVLEGDEEPRRLVPYQPLIAASKRP